MLQVVRRTGNSRDLGKQKSCYTGDSTPTEMTVEKLVMPVNYATHPVISPEQPRTCAYASMYSGRNVSIR